MNRSQTMMMIRVGRWATLAGAIGLVAGAGPGCSAGQMCRTIGTCGGNPEGIWVSHDQSNPPCLDAPYYQPTTLSAPGAPYDPTLYGRPGPVARQPQPEPTLADWCEGLVLTKDPMDLLNGRLSFVFQDPDIVGMGVRYNAADSSYEAGFLKHGRFAQWYSHTCLSRFGQTTHDCPAVQGTIRQEDVTQRFPNATCTPAGVGGGACDCAYDNPGNPGQQGHLAGEALTCQVVELIINHQGVNEMYKNVVCQPDLERGGCHCGFDVDVVSVEKGYYSRDGNVITNYPQGTSVAYPSLLTFCRHDDRLDLSGLEGRYLYNKPPLRTFALFKSTCSDGVKGPDEVGVDCGGACTTACP